MKKWKNEKIKNKKIQIQFTKWINENNANVSMYNLSWRRLTFKNKKIQSEKKGLMSTYIEKLIN